MSKNRNRCNDRKDLKHALADAIEGCIDFEFNLCHKICGLEPGQSCACKEGCEKLKNCVPTWYKEDVDKTPPQTPQDNSHHHQQEDIIMDQNEQTNSETSIAATAAAPSKSIGEKVMQFCSEHRGKLGFFGGIIVGAVGYAYGEKASAKAAEHQETVGSETM